MDYVSYNSFGISWLLDPSKFIDSEILKCGFFEGNTTEFVRAFVKPDMTVADVGANFGYFTMLFSKLVGRNGRVVAFEPVTQFRERLFRHVQINEVENVEIYPLALGASAGMVEIAVDGDTATTYWVGDSIPAVKETVQAQTLDHMVDNGFLKRLDLIKVDIDGGEPEFFRGATATIKKFKPVMIVEFSQLSLMAAGSSVDALREQLTTLGYRLHKEHRGVELKTTTEFRIYAHNCSHSVNLICVPF